MRAGLSVLFWLALSHSREPRPVTQEPRVWARLPSNRLAEQTLCVRDIPGIETLVELGIDQRKSSLHLIATALRLKDSCKAHGRSQFKEPSSLLLCSFERQ